MKITTTEHKRCDVVILEGKDGKKARIDTYTAPKLQEVLNGLTDSNRYNIVLDMSEVDFMSSKGLWVLTETQKKCQHLKRGELVLVNPDEKIVKSFDLVGMGDYFTTSNDREATVGAF